MPPAGRPARWPGLIAPGIIVALCVGAGAYATAQRFRGPEFYSALVAWQSDKCLTAHPGATAAGTGLTQEGCSGRETQLFTFTRVAGGVYLVGVAGTGDCLGMPADDDAGVREQACDGGPGQRFRLRPAGPGRFMLTSSDSATCLQVPDGAMDDGVPLVPGACGDPASAHGEVFRVDGAAPPGGDGAEPSPAGSPPGRLDPPGPDRPRLHRGAPAPPTAVPSPDRAQPSSRSVGQGRVTPAHGPLHRTGGSAGP